jgi:NAD(P)-dependent dehydrogenase (short-subunit alcohol dehydrogenase family)
VETLKGSFVNSLYGKTALVTGGSGLLGQTFCRALTGEGATVVVADIEVESAISLVSDLNKHTHARAYAVECDVSDPTSVREMIASVEQKNLQIDILVNNAATKTQDVDSFFKSFETYDLSTWRQVNSVNLDGMFLVAQAVGNHMLKNAIRGSIIQIASIYGVLSPDHRIYEGSEFNGRTISSPAAYSVSKAGVIALSNYLAAHWGHRGIRVNTISPGGIYSGQNHEFVNRYSERVPMRRMGLPDELVSVLLMFASDKSSYLTGQNVLIDGGLSTW